MIGRFIRLIFFLAVIGFLGLLGYAYSGLLQPQSRDIIRPVDLNVD